MLIRNATKAAIQEALMLANRSYDGNIITTNGINAGNTVGYFRVGLRVEDSKGKGAKLSASWSRKANGERRRTSGLCWHAYRDFLIALFDILPDAIVITSLAQYRGRTDFYMTFPNTADINVGPPISPVAYRDLCHCKD